MSALLTAALDYAAAGTPVFPAAAGGKRPLTEHGFRDASTDPVVIRRWWSRWPRANVAMATGHRFDVLDVDRRPDVDGWASLRRLHAAGLLAGAGRLVDTPSGGAHVYFRSSGAPVAHLSRFGLDFLAGGACCTLPPSVVDGGPYSVRWDRPATGPLDWSSVVQRLDPRPAVQIERTWDAQPRRDLAWLIGHVERLTEGNRNRGLFWACCRAVEDGSDPEQLVDTAVSIGLPRREAVAVARSAARTARSRVVAA